MNQSFTFFANGSFFAWDWDSLDAKIRLRFNALPVEGGIP